ncbi:siderophore-interacting protein [Bosea vestrisii]|uniref:siderophore-interacting protein n=1 Tax=Bosea vestrisii TaxID=151416 RepID=UPI0024DFFB78|nr:siderophore-interacting protein [Bosea vestrisii]WID95053.1 siderophore-interacting protein [Bosea vestrisii]
MTMLRAETRIALPDPAAVLQPLRAHLLDHEADVSETDGVTTIGFADSRAEIVAMPGALSVVVEAADLAGVQSMKLVIASHVVEFAPDGAAPAIRWSGDGAEPMLPPDFRVLIVTGVEQLTPHMRRIRFRGEDLARYDSLEALHVRLFIPPAGLAEPVWPMIGADGLLQAPPPELRPAIRKYTIREIDVAAGALAIDFVLHDDAGPGSAFAAGVQVGDRIGMAGPGGRGLKQADRYLFVADETGLPALARMLANLPRQASGLALIEVADANEHQPLSLPEGFDVRWLHRDGAAPGSTSLLIDALATLDWPPGEGSLYLWAAAEHTGFREIRATARQRLRPGIDEHLVVGYWRAGLAEEQHMAEKKQAAKAA